MVGHRTDSVYRRYAIVDETMLREGAERLTAFHRGRSPAATVVTLRKTRQPKTTRPVTRPVDQSASEAALQVLRKMVGRDGIEPPTPGFSVLCSTN